MKQIIFGVIGKDLEHMNTNSWGEGGQTVLMAFYQSRSTCTEIGRSNHRVNDTHTHTHIHTHTHTHTHTPS